MLLFDPATLGTANNYVTFSDDTLDPYYSLDQMRVVGRDVTAYDIKLPEGMGIADFQTLIGKSNIVLEGIMYPSDEVHYDNGAKSLRKLGSLDISQADAAGDSGYVPFTFTEYDGYNKRINLKVLYADLPKSRRQGIKQPFRLFCKVKYPVIESQSSISTTIGDATATTSGSSNLSFALPKALGLTTYSSNGSLNNYGDLKVYPTITITGPITTPRVTNTTTGEYIELNGLSLSTTSDSVIITYDQDTLSIAQAGVSKLNLLTSASTLFKVTTGTNNFTITGATVGSGMTGTISCRPAWPLS